jgi:hypothetical protein
MSRAPRLRAISRRFANGVSGAWLFARWLLVLALVFDQASAPFHHHHHDGVEAPRELAAAHAVPGSDEIHLDADDHESGSHFAMAIRVDASRAGELPAVDRAAVVSAGNTRLSLLCALDQPARPHWARDRSDTDFRSHRSLPPAGRAPPRRA